MYDRFSFDFNFQVNTARIYVSLVIRIVNPVLSVYQVVEVYLMVMKLIRKKEIYTNN
jgi:hypothetical protein